MKPVPVVIVTHNRLARTRRCIESIIAYSHYDFSFAYRLIVIDNASTDGTLPYLSSLGIWPEGGRVSTNGKNFGWAKGVNQGIKLAMSTYSPDYIVIGHNDTVIPGDPWWLDRLLAPFKDVRVAAVGPTSEFVRGLQQMKFTGVLDPLHEAPWLSDFFMAVKAGVLREIGLLDEDFGIGEGADLDLSIRIRKAGYKLMVNRSAFVYHRGPTPEEPNKAVLIEKWGEKRVESLLKVSLAKRGEGEH